MPQRMIDPPIQAKLDRITVLNALIKAQEDSPATCFAEYRKLQGELVPLFLPFLSLSSAGLLSVSANVTSEDEVPHMGPANSRNVFAVQAGARPAAGY
jgi:hypothetical protein